MSAAKHTPGPWEYVSKLSASENHRGFFVRAEKATKNGKWALAEVQPGDEDGKLGEANARLIVAAPELLEALREAECALSLMQSYGHCDGDAEYGRDVAQARAVEACAVVGAAIAKATGSAS